MSAKPTASSKLQARRSKRQSLVGHAPSRRDVGVSPIKVLWCSAEASTQTGSAACPEFFETADLISKSKLAVSDLEVQLMTLQFESASDTFSDAFSEASFPRPTLRSEYDESFFSLVDELDELE